MQWTDEYSVGIEEIDNQHKELLRLFSVVENSIAADQGWSSVHYAILEIKHFVEFHFEFEEAVMRMYDFPDYEQHCLGHSVFVGKMSAIVGKSLKGDNQEKLVAFFFDWLLNHIKMADRDYAQHILAGAKLKSSVKSSAEDRLAA